MKNPRIYTYTIINIPSVEFKDKAPYACVIVEDEQGARATGILEGYTPDMALEIGDPVLELDAASDGQPRFSVAARA